MHAPGGGSAHAPIPDAAHAPHPLYHGQMVGIIVVAVVVVLCVAGLFVLPRNPTQGVRDRLMRIGPFGDPGPTGDEEFEPPMDY